MNQGSDEDHYASNGRDSIGDRMARLEERDCTYFTTVRGMCRQCRSVVPARVFFRDGQVWQQSLCPGCENEPVLIAADKDWYLENVLRLLSDHAPLRGAQPGARGCPHDCVPCVWHASLCQLPVITPPPRRRR